MSEEEFVTVVSVEDAPYVTVVEVEEPLIGTEEGSAVPPPVEEDIQIYRLPGERLGFGLKFDGGPTVSGLTIESTAEGSPSARARASWGPLGPGDSILEVDGRPVVGMSRQEVVGRLTESGLVVGLRIRRGPPPVPPRRQTRRRLPGPPPPPRPLPRAPPRLVDFLPKDNSRPVDAPQESAVLKCNVAETPHEIEINGGKQLYLDKDIDPDPQTDPIQFEESLKEKITPLKNLNPKLISLFEHSQPADNNIKTSQNAHFNNNKFWLNDEKSRKSVKDKIALFSSESENNFEYKLKKSESNERNENGKKGPKKLQVSLSVPVLESESNKNYLCSRISISENGQVINENEVSEQQGNKINVQTVVSPVDSQNMTKFIIGVDKTDDATHSEPVFLQDKVQTVNKEEKYNSPAEQLSSAKSETSCTSTYSCNSLPESRKKSSIYKEKNVSKLRGLVIPQTPSRVSSAEQILDLPEIKSANLFTKGDFCDVKDEILKDQYFKPKFQSSTMSLNRNTCSSGFEWKPQFDNEIPKYSPAFKRKALSVFEIRSNYAEGHLGNDAENSQEKPCGSWLLPLNKQEEKKSDSELISKDKAESKTKYYNKILELSSEQDCNKYSSPLKTSGSREPDIELKNNEVLTSRNLGKDDNVNYFITSQENHSESSSLTSNCSQFSNNIDPEKNKNFLDSKLDSLLSQDMSDSGNHSIPSNYSKSKCDSSDESMSSLVNGEIQDSDHTSLNSSSDEGQFIEFAYKNTEALETKTKTQLTTKVNTHSLDNFSILSNNMDDMKSNGKILDNSSTPLSSQSVIKEIVKESHDNNKFNEDLTDAKASAPLVEWAETQEDPPRIPNKPDEFKESSDDVFHFRMPFPEKINHTTSAFINKRAEPKDFSADLLPKEHIIDENISSLSSPISDLQKDNHFASITSLASSTSLISHQELCQLIEESNDSSMDDTNGCPEISVIVLHRDTAEGSIGITLAGGVDYECKDITVHKVLSGSPADRDGRIKKGHRILSINGKSMKGLTHAESLAVLKAPRHEVVLVVARSQGDLFEENNNISRATLHQSAEVEFPPACPFQTGGEAKWGPIIRIILTKEGAGLGFSLKGGKDSPTGDQPLTVQKIFTGGCAEKSKQIFAGDELLSINEYDLNGMTRVEAWTLMKKLPDGEVALKIRHPAHN